MTTATRPQHGERRCYLRGCRKPECTNANKQYCKQYRTDLYLHGPRRVDIQPYLAIVNHYIDHGWSYAQIGKLAGCCETVAFNLHKGITKQLSRKAATQLDTLPATPPSTPARGNVDPTGTIRRGQALYRIGHTVRAMAPEIGIDEASLSRILTRPVSFVYGSTATAMTVLYSRWQGTPGNSTANRNRAETRGWPDPTWWEDMGHIDDPNFNPHAAEDLGSRELAALRRAEVEHLASYGCTAVEINNRVDLKLSTIRQILQELRTGHRRDRRTAA
ncbi:MAG: hypothetical protein ACRDQ0_05275 [Pseudonocardia sp.]